MAYDIYLKKSGQTLVDTTLAEYKKDTGYLNTVNIIASINPGPDAQGKRTFDVPAGGKITFEINPWGTSSWSWQNPPVTVTPAANIGLEKKLEDNDTASITLKKWQYEIIFHLHQGGINYDHDPRMRCTVGPTGVIDFEASPNISHRAEPPPTILESKRGGPSDRWSYPTGRPF